MAETNIEWCFRKHPLTGKIYQGYTFNRWLGCTKVSEACAHCYAEAMDINRYSRTLGGGTKDAPVSHWGKGAPRHMTNTLKDPIRWNKLAGEAGIALAVFCSSMSDIFDEEVPDERREEILELIHATPNLDWMLLTKRVDKMYDYLTKCMWWLNDTPKNVWLGATMENQKRFDERIDKLLATPARHHFASMEPLLGPVDISRALPKGAQQDLLVSCPCCDGTEHGSFLDLVIVGGESCERKQDARPTHPDWVLEIAAQCWAAGPPFTEFFFKQWGDWAPAYEIQDPQAQAMCLMGNVAAHQWDTGEAGRRLTFNVGHTIAGAHFEGVLRNTPLEGRLLVT